MIGWVESVSSDIASHHPDQVIGFLDEYFKVYEYLDNDWKGATLLYLRPWIGIYAQDISKKPEFLKKLFEAYLELPNDRALFSKAIWTQLASFHNSLEESLKFILLLFELENFIF